MTTPRGKHCVFDNQDSSSVPRRAVDYADQSEKSSSYPTIQATTDLL